MDVEPTAMSASSSSSVSMVTAGISMAVLLFNVRAVL